MTGTQRSLGFVSSYRKHVIMYGKAAIENSGKHNKGVVILLGIMGAFETFTLSFTSVSFSLQWENIHKCSYSHDLFRGSFKFGFISVASLIFTLLRCLKMEERLQIPFSVIKKKPV